MKTILLDSPDDLDLFGDDQIKLTRVFDAGGKPKTEQFLSYCVGAMRGQEDSLAASGITLAEWQRAAYEFSQRQKATPSARNKFIADSAWILTQYLQRLTMVTMDYVKERDEHAKGNGG